MGDSEEEEVQLLVHQEVEHEGVWASPASERCCIYRVPSRLRRVNPDAYTPRTLLIGPLHHSKKAEAALFPQRYFPSDLNEHTKSRYLDYLNMECQKKVYLEGFAVRVGIETIEQIRRTIKEDEELIRQSYAESTAWIKSTDFVDMILHDSVFILEFILRLAEKGSTRTSSGDLLIDKPCLVNTVYEDLILLENQLPYFILEKLFEPIITTLSNAQMTFRRLILTFFELNDKINDTTKFEHFTDIFRCVRVQTLDLSAKNRKMRSIKHLHNADKLDSAGVDFKREEPEYSLDVKFDKGCLRIPYFMGHDDVELIVRNIMALEQCHYPFTAYVCNYMMFLDFLIDTDKDVDLLVEKGIIINWMGHHGSVAEMVNKLCLGLVEEGSLYYDIAEQLNAHYENPINKSCATLRRTYFTNLWTGTATIAAAVLLVMALIQTVTSVIQARQGGNNDAPKSPPSPPPANCWSASSSFNTIISFVSTSFVILYLCGFVDHL